MQTFRMPSSHWNGIDCFSSPLFHFDILLDAYFYGCFKMLCTHSLLGFVWFSAPQPISNRIESSDNKTKKSPSHSYANSLSCGHLHVTFIIFVVVFVPTDSLWLAIFTFIQLHAITIFSFRCIPLCWAKLFRLFVVERTAVSLVSYANCMQTFIIWVESIYTAKQNSKYLMEIL